MYAEPEVLIKTIEPKDRFIVVASDGVFEFISNQMVVDIVSKFDNPQVLILFFLLLIFISFELYS